MELEVRRKTSRVEALEKESAEIVEMRRRVSYLENELEAASFLEGQHEQKETKLAGRNEGLLAELGRAEGELRGARSEV